MKKIRQVISALYHPSAATSIRVLPLILGTGSLMMVLSPAQAADSPEQSTAGALPRVEISEKKPDETRRGLALGVNTAVLDTPASVTSVDIKVLQDQGGQTLQDILRNVPGATADLGFTGSHSQVFVLRGFLADSGTGASRVLRDGARLSNYAFVPAFVESVEVLRGPGAAIATRSEPGGTVQIVTKQPQLRNFGSVSAGVGEYGARETTIDINRVLSQENELAARLIATHSEYSEWRGVPDRLDGIKLGISKSDGDKYHLRVGVESTDQRYRPDYGVPGVNGRPANIPVNRQLNEPWTDSTTRNDIFDVHADVAVGEQSRWAFDWTHLEADSTYVSQSLSAAVGTTGNYSRFTSLQPDTKRRIDSVSTSLTSEQKLAETTHRLYAGLEYYRENLSQPGGGVTAPSINIYNPVYGLVKAPASYSTTLTRESLESFNLSVQDAIDWQDWTLVAGVQFMKQRFFYGTSGAGVDENKVSPKVALLRHLTPEQTVYASYSTGTSPNQAASSTGQSLPSRTSRQYEAGWKSSWLNRRLNSDVALFWLEQNNMLADDPGTAYIYDKTLAGTGRSKGLEASLSGQVTEKVSVVAAYAYTNARFGAGSEFNGKKIPNVADHTLSVFGHYDWDDQWRSGVGLYAQGRRFADETNTTIMPGYGRIDLTQRYLLKLAEDRTVELQLAVRNLMNKEYYVASHLHVSRYILPGETRGVYLNATYRF